MRSQDQRAMTGFGHATPTGGLQVLYGATIRNDSALLRVHPRLHTVNQWDREDGRGVYYDLEQMPLVEILAPPGAEEFPPEVPPPSGVSIVIAVEDLRTHRADVVARGGEATSGRGGLGYVLRPRRSRRGAGLFRRTGVALTVRSALASHGVRHRPTHVPLISVSTN